mmetsp:Transcript_6492/g.9008  ORF Transcript_6492/g.9008 Transcript_6492/m.9008 type:complete len:105 (+) Transcript_6492:681-995(+)
MTADGRSSKWDGEREDMNATKTLAKCEDFASEEPALKKYLENRGHHLIMSPKGHPELAGLGIEYSWGKTKYEWRRIPVDERKSAKFYQDLNKLFYGKHLIFRRV